VATADSHPQRCVLGGASATLVMAISPRLREKALSTAEKLKLKLWQGVYVSVCGPCYETPAEVQSGRALGTSSMSLTGADHKLTDRGLCTRVACLQAAARLA
jgi:purine nucleoside phosphorylase